jgi:hypothetical protein
MLRSTLLLVERHGGSWEKNSKLRALRRALLRAIWDIEATQQRQERKIRRMQANDIQPGQMPNEKQQ